MGGALSVLCWAYFTFPSDILERNEARRLRKQAKVAKGAAGLSILAALESPRGGSEVATELQATSIFDLDEDEDSDFHLNSLSEAAKAAFIPIKTTGTFLCHLYISFISCDFFLANKRHIMIPL